MITDHSTIGFEFCALDRPLVIVDMPELLRAARVDADKARLLRAAADVAGSVVEAVAAVDHALASPAERRQARRAAVDDVFYDPGRATARAVALCHELLESPVARLAGARTAKGAAR